MLERVLENWLDNANERSFQLPFCQALASSGFTILHMSRHCGMEMGKDIIARGPDNKIYAYQLKGVNGARMTQSQFRSDLQAQLLPLATSVIVHPSVPPNTLPIPFIVINGTLNEEVQREIDDFNRSLASMGFGEQQIKVIVKGEMLDLFKQAGTDLWPLDLAEIKILLEMFLDTGEGQIPKEKLCSLLCSVLPFEELGGKAPGKPECIRAIAAGAVICSLAITPFVKRNNFSAEFEAWSMYCSHILALAERWGMNTAEIKNELSLGTQAMLSALSRLTEDLMERNHLVQGNPYADKSLLGARTTYLLGLVGLYGLYLQDDKLDQFHISRNERAKHLEFARKFCLEYGDKYMIWGEAAIPQILSYYLYRRKIDAKFDCDQPLRTMIFAILELNSNSGDNSLPSPYYEADEVLPKRFGLTVETIQDDFEYSSYTLEGLLHLYVRLNYQQHVRSYWYKITKFSFLSFLPDPHWNFYLWRSEQGYNQTTFPPFTKSWATLREEAEECEGNDLPNLIKNHPWHYLAIICTMPHRWSSSGVRWVAKKL
jgi:hypothetical protein